MIGMKKTRGSNVPELRKPIPIPQLTFKPKEKRIKTVVKHCAQQKEFDTEVNDLLKDGWRVGEISVTTSECLVMLIAVLTMEVPIEEKVGKWLKTDAYPHHVYCSECYKSYVTNEEVIEGRGGNSIFCTEAEFCPHCGVRMETEQEATENV